MNQQWTDWPPARTIIGFTGKMGCGKSTAAIELVNNGFCLRKFAGTLKAMMFTLGLTLEHIEGNLKELPCELLGGKTPRHAMQTIGTDWGRDMISPTLWIDVWKHHVNNLPFNRHVVVDDVRFDNEADAIRDMGGTVIRIGRPGLTIASSHASEHMDFGVDATIYNDGSIEDFLSEIRGLAGFVQVLNKAK